MKRAIIIVLDAVGIGELPDSAEYNDSGSNTLINLKRANPALILENMCRLGLGNINTLPQCENIFEKADYPSGLYGKMAEVSKGKDTTTGHWEISGIWLEHPFPTYPQGFPEEIITAFEYETGTKTLANTVASGTVIINELGDEHKQSGYPIIYTSADSVFQIAAHEDIIPVETLYEFCEIARKILVGKHGVGRVIARPFIDNPDYNGTNDKYIRTKNRKDFSLAPTGKTLLDYVKENNMLVKAVGKIEDIFCTQGITDSVHTSSNSEGIDLTLKYLNEEFEGLIFTNLVDTDMLYGHRNDIEGFSKCLMDFDKRLPEIISALKDDDILFITGDHGCDPTTASTDHSREYVFLLGYGKNLKPGDIGTRQTFSDLAKTIAEYLDIPNDLKGTSFLS